MLKVRFFAALRDVAGKSELDLPIEEMTPVKEVLEQLERSFPELSQYRSVLLIAVNQEFARLDAVVSPGDELCFFPPVSGGSR